MYVYETVHVTGVTLNKSSIILDTVWQTEQLTATITPANADDQTVVWSTSDSTIATVDQTWLVTCVTPWTATITVTTNDGGYTATCGVIEGRVPSTHQEVERIASSGTQYIDTLVYPTNNTVNQVKVMNLAQTWDVIYGYFAGDDDNDYRLFNYSNRIYWDIYSKRTNWSSFQPNSVYEFEMGNNYVKNVWASTNLIIWTTVWTWTGSNTITLNNFDNNTYSSNRWYYVKIWEWATQVRDMIPCYRIADWEIWMYDAINRVFYTNGWSGTFTKWPDVN